MTLSDKQKGVVRGVVPATDLVAVGLGGVSFLIPMSALPVDEPGARPYVGFAMGSSPGVHVDRRHHACRQLSFLLAGRHRWKRPDERHAQINILRAALQNTLEQTVLAFAAYSVWAAAMPLRWLCVIPVAALLFVAGRVLFARGYGRGGPGRARGFALTMYATAAMIVTTAVFLSYRLLAWIIAL